jgi:HEAT repeat protein
LLQGVNPIVLETVLEQHLKFRRGDRDLLGILEPLLDHPRTGVRARTADVLALVLEQAGDLAAPEFSAIRTRLLAKARRDPDVAVRVAATSAIARFPGDDTLRILREIATDDPDQDVRYEAERLLYDRVPQDGRARRD